VNEKLADVPVIVEDEPDEELRREMGETNLTEPSDLCGLQHGVPLTERSEFFSDMTTPVIMLFRGPICRLSDGSENELRKQIRITLLHEIGHHFGFDEEELQAIGYG